MKKIFKFLLLFFFSFLTILSILNTEVSLTINNTFFSDKYFNNNFDSNFTEEKLEIIIYDFINNMELYLISDDKENTDELKESIDSYKKILTDNLDINFIKKELPSLIKDSFAYFSGNKKDMPAINIKPIKDTIINVFADQVILHSNDASLELSNFIEELNFNKDNLLKDGKANPEIVNILLSSDIGKEMEITKSSAERIIKELATINEDNSKEILKFIIKEMIISKSKIDSMSDELDLNILFRNIYGENNPIEITRNFINNIKVNYITTSVIILISLILIIALISYNLKNILRWCGTSFMISGFISISLYSLYKNSFGLLIQNSINKIKDTNIPVIQELLSDYINGINNYLLIQSIVITILGVGLIIYSFILKKEIKTERRNTLLRFIIVIILIITSTSSVMNLIKNINTEIKEYNNKIESIPKEIDVNKALDLTLNTTLFEDTKKE